MAKNVTFVTFVTLALAVIAFDDAPPGMSSAYQKDMVKAVVLFPPPRPPTKGVGARAVNR